MNVTTTEFKRGQTIVYNDGRIGHENVTAKVLHTTPSGMLVKFQDRARTTTISFSDPCWMDFITVQP